MIKGQQVILRPATLNDRRQIFEWLAQSDLTSNMLGPPDFPDNLVPTWDEFVSDYNPNFFTNFNPDGGRSFIIEVSGAGIGHINYNEIDRSINTVELDIWLADSQHCNKGYGTDAILTLCDYLFYNFNCKAIILAPSARNKAAIRAYEKCGFQTINESLEHFVPDYYDTVIMMKKIGNEEDQ